MVLFTCKNKLDFTQTNKNKLGRVNMENKLQQLRWNKDWSQLQLSRISGVPQSVISEIENDINGNPSVYTALRLAKALSVSVEDIFTL